MLHFGIQSNTITLELLQNILMSRDILKETETPNTRDRVARKIGIFVAWPYANGRRHVGHGA